PCRPTPLTRTTSTSGSSTLAPSTRNARAVDSVSSDRPKLRISLSPSASAPKSNARCEIDFVPGTATSPTSAAAGSTRIVLADDLAHQRGQRANLVGEVREVRHRDLLRRVAESVLGLRVNLDAAPVRSCGNCRTRQREHEVAPSC